MYEYDGGMKAQLDMANRAELHLVHSLLELGNITLQSVQLIIEGIKFFL